MNNALSARLTRLERARAWRDTGTVDPALAALLDDLMHAYAPMEPEGDPVPPLGRAAQRAWMREYLHRLKATSDERRAVR